MNEHAEDPVGQASSKVVQYVFAGHDGRRSDRPGPPAARRGGGHDRRSRRRRPARRVRCCPGSGTHAVGAGARPAAARPDQRRRRRAGVGRDAGLVGHRPRGRDRQHPGRGAVARASPGRHEPLRPRRCAGSLPSWTGRRHDPASTSTEPPWRPARPATGRTHPTACSTRSPALAGSTASTPAGSWPPTARTARCRRPPTTRPEPPTRSPPPVRRTGRRHRRRPAADSRRRRTADRRRRRAHRRCRIADRPADRQGRVPRTADRRGPGRRPGQAQDAGDHRTCGSALHRPGDRRPRLGPGPVTAPAQPSSSRCARRSTVHRARRWTSWRCWLPSSSSTT